MTVRLTPCQVKGCDRNHTPVYSKRGPAHPYSGEYVDPLRPGSRSGRPSNGPRSGRAVPTEVAAPSEARDGASPVPAPADADSPGRRRRYPLLGRRR